ncbi:hypothetical protein C5167_010995 [Papaver somniferum]|uniref:Uncharacterized protein n=1 Tax=Papaver somniferum TaxID=3469 RepID=A0A4Y7K4M8_PAPSO|nr:hypothetical protein C5167_010995 [Papaver somniferum]
MEGMAENQQLQKLLKYVDEGIQRRNPAEIGRRSISYPNSGRRLEEYKKRDKTWLVNTNSRPDVSVDRMDQFLIISSPLWARRYSQNTYGTLGLFS